MSDILSIVERMAEHGTAPDEGCNLFGVGYDDAFDRLRSTYLKRRFERGGSAEKFVVGPFGSGKTHFLRQLAEIARDEGCATAEVALNRDVDFTQNLVVFREVARRIRPAGSTETGINSVLTSVIDRLSDEGPELLQAWIEGVDKAEYESTLYARVLKRALQAHVDENPILFQNCCRWLSGEITDRTLCKELGISVISKAEHGLFGKHALLTLCQFIRHSGSRGTVIGFDEAEQGFDVDRKRVARIHSMLQSSINAVSDLVKGSVLIVYAVTVDVFERMEGFAALQQRVADPGPNQGFFDGNTLAPKVDLTLQEDHGVTLENMGIRLAEMFYGTYGDKVSVSEDEAKNFAKKIAREIADSDPSSSNRRTMARRFCTALTNIYDGRPLESGQQEATEFEGVDEEV